MRKWSRFLIAALCVSSVMTELAFGRVLVGRGYYNLAFWGDSLTFGIGATNSQHAYPYQAANLPPAGRWFFNGGVGGQTSTQVAVRQGGVVATVTVSGGQIPASGGVTITFPVGYEPVTNPGPADGILGSISGVSGRITLSGGVYTFTRTLTGSAVNVSSAPLLVDNGLRNNGTVGFWTGRNNYPDPVAIKNDTAAMVASLPHTRYLVLSLTNGEVTQEHVGGSIYNMIAAINADFAATYGDRYVDVRSVLVAAYNPANTMDVFDHANDVPPFTLRAVLTSGTIVEALGASDTSFTTSAAVIPGYVLTVDSEYIYVNTVSGTSVTNAKRGYGGSIAATHSAGAAFAGTDPLHFNDAGYGVIAATVNAKINANHW